MSMLMDNKTKIYIAGQRYDDLVLRTWRALKFKGYEFDWKNEQGEIDLENQKDVLYFYEQEKPDVVIDAAAKIEEDHLPIIIFHINF